VPTLNAADGCRIYYEVEGDGPPLVLIPGLGGSAGFWSDIARHLIAHFRVISFDHRGAGRSDRPLGIRVNSVAPGVAWSNYYDQMLKTVPDPDGFVAGLKARSPLNRVAQPDEIANAILYLASMRRALQPVPW